MDYLNQILFIEQNDDDIFFSLRKEILHKTNNKEYNEIWNEKKKKRG